MGMFRRGRERPTFDTEVTFIPIGRKGQPGDRSRGYGSRTSESPAVPANVKLMADIRDISAREAPVGAIDVSTTSKSLIFAQGALAPLLTASRSPSGLAKSWKIRIGDQEMDIVGVQDSWAPNLYSRIIAEDRR